MKSRKFRLKEKSAPSGGECTYTYDVDGRTFKSLSPYMYLEDGEILSLYDQGHFEPVKNFKGTEFEKMWNSTVFHASATGGEIRVDEDRKFAYKVSHLGELKREFEILSDLQKIPGIVRADEAIEDERGKIVAYRMELLQESKQTCTSFLREVISLIHMEGIGYGFKEGKVMEDAFGNLKLCSFGRSRRLRDLDEVTGYPPPTKEADIEALSRDEHF